MNTHPAHLATTLLYVSVLLAATAVINADEVRPGSRLIAQLGSPEFQERVAASRALRELSATDLQQLLATIEEQPGAEVVIRLLDEVDNRYASGDDADQQVASAALEALCEHSRQLLAQGASQSLQQHWHRRVELAIKSLEEAGAVVKRGTFTRGSGWPANSSLSLQILLGEGWRGGDAGVQLFKRFGPLLGPVRGPSGVVVYLLTGHTLNARQAADLNEIVGSNRVTERSRVALGIIWDREFGEHVMIQESSPGGSAAVAGLGRGDLIIAIETAGRDKLTGDELQRVKKAELLRDFDDLVERLKQYRPDDVINLRVARRAREQLSVNGGELDNVKQEIVPVKLMAWEELPVR